MNDLETRKDLGRRLKNAAKGKGLDAPDVARDLDVTVATVHNWWAGRSSPKPQKIRDYADLVGSTVDELIPAREGNGERIESLSEAIQRALGLVGEGMDPAEALSYVAGLIKPGLQPSVADLERFTGRGEELRRALVEHSPEVLAELSPEQREAVLNLARLLAEGNRRATL